MSGTMGLLIVLTPLLAILLAVAVFALSSSKAKKRTDHSKQLVTDIRELLWIVTVGGLLLAALCIVKGYTGSLPWLAAMVGCPWTAHGVVCSFYLNMAKSDHKEGGITFEAAKAKNFEQSSENSPPI